MCAICNQRSSPEAGKLPSAFDVSKMVEQILKDTAGDIKKLIEISATSRSTTTLASTIQELPNTVHQQKNINHMTESNVTLYNQLAGNIAEIIKAIESIKADEQVVPEPSVFFPKNQSPNAHLSILRNPTRAYLMNTPAFSPTLGHASDAYIRLKQRQYLNDAITIKDREFISNATNKAHRKAQGKRYQQARKSTTQIRRDHNSWVFNRVPVDKVLKRMNDEASFWRSFAEDREYVTDEDGNTEEVWSLTDTPDNIGQAIEDEMQLRGRSIDEWRGLVQAVENTKQEELDQGMDKQRQQCQSKYLPADYNSDSEEEDCDDKTYWCMSRPSSPSSSAPDLEADSITDCVAEEQINVTSPEIEKMPTPLELAQADLTEYTTIFSKAVSKTKKAFFETTKEELEAPIREQEAHAKERNAQKYPNLLAISITNLRIRMAQDGLLASPSNPNHQYTSNNSTGPGSITFVGPITGFLAQRQAILDKAFTIACQDETVQNSSKMDFYEEVKVSMEHVTNIWRDARKVSVFLENSRSAAKKKEGVEDAVTGAIGLALQGAREWVRMMESKEQFNKVEKLREKYMEAVEDIEEGEWEEWNWGQ